MQIMDSEWSLLSIKAVLSVDNGSKAHTKGTLQELLFRVSWQRKLDGGRF